jgi:hypothetical protein
LSNPAPGGPRRVSRVSWRVMVVLIVALVLGAGVGGIVEHQRAVEDSNAKPVDRVTTTTATVSVWFGSRQSSACPALEKWNLALDKVVYAVLAKDASWDSVLRPTLLNFNSTAETTYRSLLEFANPAGKAELEFLVTSARERRGVIKGSTSLAAFLKTQTPGRLARDFRFVLQTALSCA